MSSTRSKWLRYPERLLALIFLVLMLPAMPGIVLFIYLTSTGPVLLVEKCTTPTGRIGHIRRFRTEGEVGKFLRKYNLQVFPALWSIVRGDITLREFLRLS